MSRVDSFSAITFCLLRCHNIRNRNGIIPTHCICQYLNIILHILPNLYSLTFYSCKLVRQYQVKYFAYWTNNTKITWLSNLQNQSFSILKSQRLQDESFEIENKYYFFESKEQIPFQMNLSKRQPIVPLYISLVPISSCADIDFFPLQKRYKRKMGTK